MSSAKSEKSNDEFNTNDVRQRFVNPPFGSAAPQVSNMPDRPVYTSATGYAEAVRQWIMQYHMWSQAQYFQMTIPYYVMGAMSAQQSQTPSNSNLVNRRPLVGAHRRHNHVQPHRVVTPNRVPREFRIASVYKRVAAELIDFLLLFILKLAVTIVAVEYMGLIDLDQYDLELEKLFSKDMDLNVALGLTTELVALEVINRVFITLFEAMCLRKGIAGTIGGTTPGKKVMGILVVSCEDFVIDMGHGVVRITPAGDIGFWNALVRSVIKNFSLAFFFPVCFTALFFQHHRAAYDVISNCIVVEPLRPMRR